MIRLLTTIGLLAVLACNRQPEKPAAPPPKPAAPPPPVTVRHYDTLPNGQRWLDTRDPAMHKPPAEVVGPDTLKGGYIACYAIDDSTKYFYLRHDTLHLLRQMPAHQPAAALGKPDKDYDDFFTTRIDNGNGSPVSYQVFEKSTGRNLLGEGVTAASYKAYNDSLFFLYDNYYFKVNGRQIERNRADSVFLYNCMSGRRQAYKLPYELPFHTVVTLYEMSKQSFTVQWQTVENERPRRVTYKR